MHVADVETGLAARVDAVGGEGVGLAGAADRRVVVVAVVVGDVVRTLAGPLPLELGAETFALFLADGARFGLADPRQRDRAGLGGVVETIDEEAFELDGRPGQLLVGDAGSCPGLVPAKRVPPGTQTMPGRAGRGGGSTLQVGTAEAVLVGAPSACAPSQRQPGCSETASKPPASPQAA